MEDSVYEHTNNLIKKAIKYILSKRWLNIISFTYINIEAKNNQNKFKDLKIWKIRFALNVLKFY
jgi:hypothetical protein